MTERELDDIIHRYQNGLASPDEVKFLDDLQQKNLHEPEDDALFDDRREVSQVHDRIWKKLISEVDHKVYRLGVRPSFQQQTYLWAASVSILLTLSVLAYVLFSPSEHDYTIYAKNESTNVDRPVLLPDGSKILLKASSAIALHQQFNQIDRRVQLYGSAFFDVARNEDKPFIIQADRLQTKVLGTSFAINNSEAGREIEVKVYTGKVSVRVDSLVDKTGSSELVLTPNLKAVYSKESNTLREALVDNLTVLPAENLSEQYTFDYHEEKLKHILNQIENAYGIDIILLNEDDGNRILTGDLKSLTLFQKLNLICNVADLQYEIKGSKIILRRSH